MVDSCFPARRRIGGSRRQSLWLALLLLSGPASAQTPAPAQPTAPAANAVAPPALQILGYGDVNYVVQDNGREAGGDHFGLGQFDLLFLSNLSDTWRVLAEPVIKVDGNEFTTELERLVVTYAPRDYFEVGLGRFNTSFGYYGSTYSHSTYFQTATTRPILFEFEDDGGLLPEHSTGASVSGRLPGSLRARYIVEVGNGQPLRSSSHEATDDTADGETEHSTGSSAAGQSVRDENRSKAVNLGLQLRPAAVPGLQFGGNGYFDTIGPRGEPMVKEKIFGAFVAFQNERWEMMAEAVRITTRLGSGPDYDSGGFYLQAARQFAAVRPFARYQRVNVPEGEPGLGHETGRTSGPSFGVRFDPGPYVALKFQVDRFAHSERASDTSFIAQMSFSF